MLFFRLCIRIHTQSMNYIGFLNAPPQIQYFAYRLFPSHSFTLFFPQDKYVDARNVDVGVCCGTILYFKNLSLSLFIWILC